MSNTTQNTIVLTECERRFALEQAEHSGEMEGLHVDPATRADAEEYVTGNIDSNELVARTRARSRARYRLGRDR